MDEAPQVDGPEEGEIEEVDALPVLVEPPPAPAPAPRSGSAVVARQAATVAATGFVAGAVTVAAVKAVGARRARRKATKRGQLVNVVASRSFLVDVHLLGSGE
jgi:hypothetical protein